MQTLNHLKYGLAGFISSLWGGKNMGEVWRAGVER